MHRFRNIMVLYNRRPGDESALERAIALAQANIGVLTLAETISMKGAADRAETKARRAHMDRFAEGLRHKGITTRSVLLEDDPTEEIPMHALAEKVDLIIASSAVDRGFGAFGPADAARKLMRYAPCPVWIIPPEIRAPLNSVVAAIALHGPEDHGLDVRIANLAAAVAQRENRPLDLLHVWEFEGDARVQSRSEISGNALAGMVDAENERRSLHLRRVMRDAGIGEHAARMHFRRGTLEAELPRFVSETGAGLVVAGARPRPGLFGLRTAGLVEDLPEICGCSVLAAKSANFVTPAVHAMQEMLPGWQPPSAA